LGNATGKAGTIGDPVSVLTLVKHHLAHKRTSITFTRAAWRIDHTLNIPQRDHYFRGTPQRFAAEARALSRVARGSASRIDSSRYAASYTERFSSLVREGDAEGGVFGGGASISCGFSGRGLRSRRRSDACGPGFDLYQLGQQEPSGIVNQAGVSTLPHRPGETIEERQKTIDIHGG
jgi:hypothetical protein